MAGCEAALQLARFGLSCTLVEMRPRTGTPAHRSGRLAEIVCSNSLKSTVLSTASGLLKEELKVLGCRLLICAAEAAVPAGSALAVDREVFSSRVEELVAAEPRITRVTRAVRELPDDGGEFWLLATGPLTTESLQTELARLTGRPHLHFFDAIAPTVTLDSLDLNLLYRAARYGKGSADYLNAPLDRAAYEHFVGELVDATTAEVAAFEREELFPGCQPIEEIARSGPQSLAFGPLRPVGLADPASGAVPHAVVQLRQENRAGNLYGLVGFQTRLQRAEQKRVFRLLPGMARAEFVRFGQLHRNFYLDSPRCLRRDFSLIGRPDVFVAGQMAGVEGYVESIASGLLTAWRLAARLRDKTWLPLPRESLLGGLLEGHLFDHTTPRFTPMNVNFGLLPPPAGRIKGKKLRKEAQAAAALTALRKWVAANPLRF